MVAEGRRRTPWLVSLMQAHYRKNLPAWERIYDAALEQGQDPATRMSISQNIIMEMATERVDLIRMAKEGKSVEEITEAADRKSTRLNSSHVKISYAVFCLKKKTTGP